MVYQHDKKHMIATNSLKITTLIFFLYILVNIKHFINTNIKTRFLVIIAYNYFFIRMKHEFF